MFSTEEQSRVLATLRDAQRAAFEKIKEYLDAPHGGQSFLAVLPTGAGKSGLIATLAQSQKVGVILILSPRVAVCDQLTEQVSGGFFADRSISVSRLRDVEDIDDEFGDSSIYVETFQKLLRMKEGRLRDLQSRCSLVIIDEGHAEPAPKWGALVRSFECHKVILTATPYRNDLFQFNVGQDKNFCYTFRDAVSDGVIVDPEFQSCGYHDLSERVKDFIKLNPIAKVIVKTKNFEDVLAFKKTMVARGLSVLAIHERFKSNISLGELSDVPKDIKDLEFQVIVHQRKLDEGVDLPSAKLCILTYPIASGRELVQTVGRVVRVFKGVRPLVLDCATGSNQRLWENYKEFDRYISDPAAWAKFVRSLDIASLIESYLNVFPDVTYLGSTFKRKFDIQSIDVDKDVVVPMASVCFLSVESEFTIESFVDTLLWRYRREGELSRLCLSLYGFHVILSVKFDNSKYLKSCLFFEPSLHVTIAKVVGDLLAVYDSRSINHANDIELQTMQPVEVQRLLSLSTRGKSVRVKETHARAVGTSRSRPERVSQISPDLNAAPNGQATASYALSVTKVVNVDATDRVESSYYLSAASGRVADQKHHSFSLETLSEWLDEVASVISNKVTQLSPAINGYALPIAAELSGDPVSATFDFSGLAGTANLVQGSSRGQVVAGIEYVEVSSWNFRLAGVKVSMAYSSDEERIIFSSKHPISMAVMGAPESDFIDYLNRCEVKILFAGGVSYVGGKFYRSSLPTLVGFDLETTTMRRIFFPLPELQALGLTEKGEVKQGEYVGTLNEKFDQNSVFDIIDSLAKGPHARYSSLEYRSLQAMIADADIVICSDMGTEAADFIISSPRLLCYIHAKCGDSVRPRSSAGALAEVGSQAVKNIEYLITSDTNLPFGNAALLPSPWPSPGATYKISRRLRVLKRLGENVVLPASNQAYKARLEKAISIIAERRRSPACRKEAWIVAANSFSFSSFKRQLAKGSSANAESLQAYQLMDSWAATCSANDVELRVIVSP
ncbi:type III restriction enzyme, res subunit [Stenotrophomonas sp. SKA14]|uniref:DEAD/DEAH box helicase n=1 Tax=Stenotrophomonas TaxID=40323 RepID=UPI00018FF538|nr:DEAD/DEAH box helicase family protein [Stenotrophomonas sp. SKA14]EED40814.1 type III restriction enzyme, res subunit [Stenotrophomonas sp. SKA14]